MRSPARRVLLAALLSLAVAAVTAPSPASAVALSSPHRTAASPLPHALGAIPPSSRLAASAVLAAQGRTRMALPVSVDLASNAPAIGDQGQVGSCATWAIGYGILGYYARTQPHAGAPFAPLSVYNLVNGGGDNGSRSSDIYAVLQQKGIVEKSVWTHGAADYLSQPNATEAANALKHRTSGGSYLFLGQNQGTSAMTAIETALAAGKPVAIGIPVYMPFEYLNSTDSVMTSAKATGSMLGGHMIAAYGYDSTGVKIANSWGTGWGRNGYATLGWDFVQTYAFEASTPNAFISSTPVAAPTVTAVAPRKLATAGGTTLTVTGTNFATSTVAVVSVSDPTQSYPATVTNGSATSLTVTAPAVPSEGAYRLVVTTSAGSSADTAADDLAYVTKPAFSVPSTVLPATSGGDVTLNGSGFGSGAAAFTALGWTASAGGRSVPLRWVSDSSIVATLPAGTPGPAPSIVLSRSGVSSEAVTGVVYGANIGGATAGTDASGRLLQVTGKGFAGSTGWALKADGAAQGTSLPVRTDLTAVGVVIANDTSATLRLPTAPGPAGVYKVSFTPNTTTYPGAVFADTPAARVTYALPKVTGLSSAVASTAGGTAIVVKGSGFLAVDPGSAGGVTVVPAAGGSPVAATVTSRTDGTLSVTLPTVQSEGAYRVVVTTPLGTAAVTGTADQLTYVRPLPVSLPSGAKVLAVSGGLVRVTGSGFGGTNADVASGAVTATVNGKKVPVTWVSDGAVLVPVPSGTPGATATIVLLRQGIASAPLSVPYVASISGLSTATGPSAGGTVVTVTGKGFAGASTWSLTAPDGTTVATLPALTSLDGSGPGVLVVSDTQVKLRMPAASAPFLPVLITFTPDQALYPGASSALTSRAVFTYSDLG